eukprot:m.59783 g.59783  ORF g.59783 m.59783 type:complete len:311 (+) comp34899_c0_seq4:1018-1950(+)
MYELLQVSQVCQLWRSISRHPSLWKHVHLTGDHIRQEVLEKLSNWCTETESLSLEGLGHALAPAHYDENLSSYKNRMAGSFELGLDKFLCSSSLHVKSVSIYNCSLAFTEKCLWIVSRYCTNLESFEFVGNARPIAPESLWSLGVGCPHVKFLRVPPVPFSEAERYFTDGCLNAIGHAWPRIQSIGIGGALLTLSGITNLIKACPRLQHLEIEHVGGLNESAIAKMCKVGLKGLENLKLSFTKIEPSALRYLLGACPRLESVSIHVGVSDYFTDIKNPKTLSNFKEEIDKLRALQNGDLKGILEITDSYG